MGRAVLLLLTALVAGCGGAAATPEDGRPEPRDRIGAAPLKVGATQLRLGDATAADDRRGSRQLPVGPRSVVPEALHSGDGRRDGVGAGASCADRDLLPDASNATAVRAATLCLLNGERADAGLVALRTSARLAAAAEGHSVDMVGQQFFSHTSADGRDLAARIRVTGYLDPRKAWTVGENIAWGSGTLATPASIVAAWMASPGHRDNLLNPAFREIGIGVALGSPRQRDLAGAATYTTDFGTVGDPDARPVAAVAAVARKAKPGPRARRAASRRTRKAQRARKAPLKARIALGPEASPPGQ
jgi:uncharacterized protein YkwD